MRLKLALLHAAISAASISIHPVIARGRVVEYSSNGRPHVGSLVALDSVPELAGRADRARYAALATLNEQGTGLQRFLTAGVARPREPPTRALQIWSLIAWVHSRIGSAT